MAPLLVGTPGDHPSEMQHRKTPHASAWVPSRVGAPSLA